MIGKVKKFGNMVETSIVGRLLVFAMLFILFLFCLLLISIMLLCVGNVGWQTTLKDIISQLNYSFDLIFVVKMIGLYFSFYFLVVVSHFIMRLFQLEENIRRLNRFDFFLHFVVAFSLFFVFLLVSITSTDIFSIFVSIISILALTIQLVVPPIRKIQKEEVEKSS